MSSLALTVASSITRNQQRRRRKKAPTARTTDLVGAVHAEVREAGGGPPSVGAVPRHLRLVPHVDADADEQEGELGLDQHPGHLGLSKEDVVRPLERNPGLVVVLLRLLLLPLLLLLRLLLLLLLLLLSSAM